VGRGELSKEKNKDPKRRKKRPRPKERAHLLWCLHVSFFPRNKTK